MTHRKTIQNLVLLGLILAIYGTSLQTASALISNASCSSGQAKSSGCQGGNEVGGDPKNDASCCAKAIAAPRGNLLAPDAAICTDKTQIGEKNRGDTDCTTPRIKKN